MRRQHAGADRINERHALSEVAQHRRPAAGVHARGQRPSDGRSAAPIEVLLQRTKPIKKIGRRRPAPGLEAEQACRRRVLPNEKHRRGALCPRGKWIVSCLRGVMGCESLFEEADRAEPPLWTCQRMLLAGHAITSGRHDAYQLAHFVLHFSGDSTVSAISSRRMTP